MLTVLAPHLPLADGWATRDVITIRMRSTMKTDTKGISLSLVIPCFNEQNTLEECVQRCIVLREHGIGLEIIIVDDCSSDTSLSIASNLSEKYAGITVCKHAVNQGKGAALHTGFLHATGDYVGVQDADMEYEPLDYLTLLEPLVAGKTDVVYGSRYLRAETRRVLYFWHTWMNRTLTFVSNMFTNLDISDMETCYKLFRRDVIQSIAPHLKEKRFGFEPEITAHVARKGYRVYECAIHYNPRSYEEGKKIGWKDGVRALYCVMHYGASTAPLPMQILLYFFIGGVCALLNLFSFSMALAAGMTVTGAIILAFGLAATANYLLCIAILFRHKARWSTGGELGVYALSVAIMGAVDYGVTVGLIGLSVGSMWSKFWAVLVGFVGNFILRKYMVFPERLK